MLKADENPPITWPQNACVADFQGCWWVAHTKSRNEKALAMDLMTKDINYFLPMSWRVRNVRGRKIRTLLPLFGGYLFLCGDERQRVESLRTNRIANIISVDNQQQLVEELSDIQRAIQAGAVLLPHKYIEKGQKCRITAGPLMGMEGVVTRTRGVTALVLQIDMLGQAAGVEVDTDTVEVVD